MTISKLGWAYGYGVRAEEAFLFPSEALLTFLWQGKKPLGIGRLVIVGGKEIRESKVTPSGLGLFNPIPL